MNTSERFSTPTNWNLWGMTSTAPRGFPLLSPGTPSAHLRLFLTDYLWPICLCCRPGPLLRMLRLQLHQGEGRAPPLLLTLWLKSPLVTTQALESWPSVKLPTATAGKLVWVYFKHITLPWISLLLSCRLFSLKQFFSVLETLPSLLGVEWWWLPVFLLIPSSLPTALGEYWVTLHHWLWWPLSIANQK